MKRKSQKFVLLNRAKNINSYLCQMLFFLLAIATSSITASPALAVMTNGERTNIENILTGPVGAMVLIILGLGGFGMLFIGGRGNRQNTLAGVLFLILGTIFFGYRVFVLSGAAESLANRYH